MSAWNQPCPYGENAPYGENEHNFVPLIHLIYNGDVPRVAVCSKCGVMR